MEYTVDAPELGDRRVSVQTPGLFSAARLLVDGQIVPKQGQSYFVSVAEGHPPVEIKLKNNVFDPVPVIQLSGRDIRLVPALQWYEYIWACAPLVLIGIGGALGGMLGGAAAWTNLAIFRSSVSPALRYVFSALLSLTAVVLFLTATTALQGSLGRR